MQFFWDFFDIFVILLRDNEIIYPPPPCGHPLWEGEGRVKHIRFDDSRCKLLLFLIVPWSNVFDVRDFIVFCMRTDEASAYRFSVFFAIIRIYRLRFLYYLLIKVQKYGKKCSWGENRGFFSRFSQVSHFSASRSDQATGQLQPRSNPTPRQVRCNSHLGPTQK